MFWITNSKRIKLILILLTSWFSVGQCRMESTSLKLSCNITTLPEHTSRQILAVNKCPKDYQDVDIINKCENLIDTNTLINDKNNRTNFKLYTPVLNSFENIAYWNEYCATCNNKTEFEYWAEWSELNQVDELCIEYTDYKSFKSNHFQDSLDKTRNFIREKLKLISKWGNSTELQCSMEENWPMTLLNFTMPCLPKAFKITQRDRLKSCQYFKKNYEICDSMQFIIEGIDFAIDEFGQLETMEWSDHTGSLLSEYSFLRGIDNEAYLCVKKYSSLFDIKGRGSSLSIICIVIYLLISSKKSYLQSFPNKILYSYSAGLFFMYLLMTSILLSFPLTCLDFDLFFFPWFFHFFWTVIVCLEFCRFIYCTVKKRKISVASQPKRYFVYCVIGFVIPVVLPIIYFLILGTNKNRCPSVPDHFGVPCRADEDSMAYYFRKFVEYIYFGSFSIIVCVLLVLKTCVFVYLTKFGSIQIRSIAKSRNFLVLLKMAYLMGAQWILIVFLLYFWLGDESGNENFFLEATEYVQSFSDYQGVFLFFAFTFQKTMQCDILRKRRRRGSNVQQSSSGETAMTVRSSSTQPTSLTEPTV